MGVERASKSGARSRASAAQEKPKVAHPTKNRKRRFHQPRCSPRRSVAPFKPANHEEEDEDDEIVAIKKKVRHAMDVLEEGKAVAALKLLKRIVEA